MSHLLRETRRTELNRRLRNAKARLARAESEIADIQGELDSLQELEALDLLRSWRGIVDWPALMRRHLPTSIYMLRGHLLDRMGLRSGFDWADIDEPMLSISVPAASDAGEATRHVERVRGAVEFMLPFMKPHNDGRVWFTVIGEGLENYGIELRMTPDQSTVSLTRAMMGRVHSEEICDGLGDALVRIQSTWPGDPEISEGPVDPNAMPGETGQALRQAMRAFVEGCRGAGVPVSDNESFSTPE